MKVLNLLMTVLLMVVMLGSAHAQLQAVEWASAYGGTGHEYGYSVSQTSDGGYIVAGSAASTNGDLTGRPTGRGTDAWVVKLDDTGAIQWHKALGGTGTDYAYAVRQTTDGGYIMGGYTNSDNGDVVDKRSGYGFDFWAVKLDATGEIVWSKTFGSTTRDEGYDIQQTFDGGYAMIGRTLGAATGDVSSIYSPSKYDYWVVKMSANGTLEWERTYGGTGTDDPTAIRQTADSGYILVGYASDSVGGLVTENKGNSDYWVVKTDKAGVPEWQKSYGGSRFDVANDVRQTKDGGYVVIGKSDSQDGDLNAFLHGNNEYWVLRLDDTGKILWQRILGGSGSDQGYSIELADDEGYIIAGVSASNDGDVTSPNGGNDFWMVKLNELGETVWEKSAGGSGSDVAYALGVTRDGGCIITGQTQSSNGDVHNHNGGIDMFVVKLLPVPLDSVAVTVQGGAAPEITTAGASLRLEATIYPTGLSQNVTWDIIPVTGAATVDASGTVVAQLNGTVWGKATAVADPSMMDSILITLSNQVIPVDSVVITTQNGVAPQITAFEGTLQLVASVYPSAVSQDVTWSIVSETGNAMISTSGLVTAVSNGTVWAKAVSVADANRMDSLLVTITGQELSVPEIATTSHLASVYPNPSHGSVFILSRTISVPVEIKVSDVCGREVMQLSGVSLHQPAVIDIGGLPSGIYVLHLKGEGVDIREKITRQ